MQNYIQNKKLKNNFLFVFVNFFYEFWQEQKYNLKNYGRK